MSLSPEQEKLAQIFHPNIGTAIKNLENPANPANKVTAFAHYTNADAAINILQTKEVWLRNAAHMNDYSEVKHGLDCLINTYNTSDAGRTFRQTLDNIFPGICAKIEVAFNQRMQVLIDHTYIVCISEHYDREKDIGRLSMWRAYGGKTGVALLLNTKRVVASDDPINGIVSSNVAYLDRQETQAELNIITHNVISNYQFLRNLGEAELINRVYNMFILAALCMKHKGFEEEKEWRVIYNPEIFHKSDEIKRDIVRINNELQIVYKIPLKNIPALLNGVIIGPTPYPDALKEKFIEILANAGVENPRSKVLASNIPLRG